MENNQENQVVKGNKKNLHPVTLEAFAAIKDDNLRNHMIDDLLKKVNNSLEDQAFDRASYYADLLAGLF